MNPAIILTLIRLAIGPVFAYCFIAGYNNQSHFWLWFSLAILTIIELSDAFDGYIARKRNEVTELGKVFDPVADSLARLTAFLSFVMCGIIPLWMFLLFLYRDSLMSLLRIICASRGTVLAARKSGKIKAIIQAVALFTVVIICIIHSYGLSIIPEQIAGRHPGFWIVFAPVTAAVLSIFDYIIPNWSSVLKGMEHTDQ